MQNAERNRKPDFKVSKILVSDLSQQNLFVHTVGSVKQTALKKTPIKTSVH